MTIAYTVREVSCTQDWAPAVAVVTSGGTITNRFVANIYLPSTGLSGYDATLVRLSVLCTSVAIVAILKRRWDQVRS